jgi:hypothetical protein
MFSNKDIVSRREYNDICIINFYLSLYIVSFSLFLNIGIIR